MIPRLSRFLGSCYSQKVGLVYDEAMMNHRDYPELHPLRLEVFQFHYECPERVEVTVDHLQKEGIFEKCEFMSPRLAEIEEMEVCHTRDYIESIQKFSTDEGYLTAVRNGHVNYFNAENTYFSEGSTEAIFLGCGSVLTAVEDVYVSENCDHVFCVVRPPGHHAETEEAMGFCFINSVGIGAIHAKEIMKQKGIENPKIAIVDFDYHHGNAHQVLADQEPEILVLNTHMDEYPWHCGDISEVGIHHNNINIQYDTKFGSSDLYAAFDEIIFPILRKWKPDLIFVSAGFDTCTNDPVAMYGTVPGTCYVNPELFGPITKELMEISDHMIMMLEGGYNIDNVKFGVAACIRALLGEEVAELESLVDGDEISDESRRMLEKVKEIHVVIFRR